MILLFNRRVISINLYPKYLHRMVREEIVILLILRQKHARHTNIIKIMISLIITGLI
jgi:hypothetical protein